MFHNHCALLTMLPCIYLIEKNVVGRRPPKRYDPVVCWETSELFTDLHFEIRSLALFVCFDISHFVRRSLMYSIVNDCWRQDLVLRNSFPAKIALTQVRTQTLANFALCSAQIDGEFGHLQVGLHGFRCHVQLAAINISHKRTGLYFEYANDNVHLPKNPLGLIVNGLCFSPDNDFSVRCIPRTKLNLFLPQR